MTAVCLWIRYRATEGENRMTYYLPSLCTKINGHDVTLLMQIIVQNLQDTSRVTDKYTWTVLPSILFHVICYDLNILPETASKFLIWFKFAVLRTISSNTGTDPPTKPVFPPCGTTANLENWFSWLVWNWILDRQFYNNTYLCSLQYFKISDTCWVVFGLRTSLDFPLYLFIQSVL